MNEYLSHFIDAIKKVPAKYVQYETYTGFDESRQITDQNFIRDTTPPGLLADEFLLEFLERQGEIKKHSLERNFCYELYHQWKVIMHNEKNRTLYEGLQLNGEINKVNLCIPIRNYQDVKYGGLLERARERGLLDKGYFGPDLVLHGGYDDISKQILIAEVKRVSADFNNTKFSNDFYRLAIYQRLYRYRHVAFILLNCEEQTLQRYCEGVETTVADPDSFSFILRSTNETKHFKLRDVLRNNLRQN